MINQLKTTGEWNKLSENDKSEILNMSDAQKAQLSLLLVDFSVENDNNNKMQKIPAIQKNRAVSCLGVALGISAVNDIISGTAALMTVETGVQLLKVMGKRYLGYLGLAIAVYEFVDCIS